MEEEEERDRNQTKNLQFGLEAMQHNGSSDGSQNCCSHSLACSVINIVVVFGWRKLFLGPSLVKNIYISNSLA